MIFTRSSRMQTRASTKRILRCNGVNKREMMPTSSISDNERISTKQTSRKSINARRKSPTPHNQNVSKNSSVEMSRKFGKDSKVDEKKTVATTLQLKKKERILQTTFDSSENFIVYSSKEDYQRSLTARSGGNPLLRNIVTNFDKHVSLFKFKARDDGGRSSIREDILEAFQTLISNGSDFEFIGCDQELATMGITQKAITVKLSNMYISMKSEMKRLQTAQSKRLRPRGEKIDYSLLNGAKSSSRTSSLRNKGPEASHGVSSSSTELRRENCSEISSLRAGNIRHCIMGGDAASNSFEASSAKLPRCFKARQNLVEHPHFERRRRNCSSNIINWKYCYCDEASARKPMKRPQVNEKSPSAAKRLKACKSAVIDISDDSESDGPQGSSFANEMRTNSRRGSEIQATDADGRKKGSVEVPDRKEEVKIDNVCLPKAFTKDNANHRPVVGDIGDRHESGGELKSLEEVLKGFIKKAAIDESKLKMAASPLIAELAEVNNDQFYRLVVALQGTEFLVKSAVMKNVRSSSGKIAQVYNCTVCHIEDVEKQLASGDCKGRHSVCSKPVRSFTPRAEKPAADSKARSVFASARVSADCHCRSRPDPSTSKQKLPSQPQQKSLAPRVPPIIFPAHVGNHEFVIDNLSSAASDDTEEQRAVVRATCFESLPSIDSDSEDSDSSTIDADFKRSIVSDAVQNDKWSSDYRSVYEALKRMGRRKTNPDIHPATRRLRQRMMKINRTEVRSSAKLWHDKDLDRGERAGDERIRDSPPQHFHSAFLTPERNSNPPKVFASSLKPQRVFLDNRGRFLNLRKEVTLVEETPATALTASERLKLLREENAKISKAENQKVSLEQSSSSTASPSPVRKFKDKRAADSCNDSDFELDGNKQPQKAVVCPASSSSLAEIRPANAQISSNSGIIHVKIIPRPQTAAAIGPKISSKPTPHDKDGYRKILPKPSLTPKISQTSHTATLPVTGNVNVVRNPGTQRQVAGNREHRATGAPVKQQEQKMCLLKSVLGQKSLMPSGGKMGREEGTCEMTNVRRTFTDGSLRVPPASSYMSAPAAATVRLPTYLRPITVQLTHTKGRSFPVSNDGTSKDQGK